LVKLRDAITFLDSTVPEKQASAEDHMTKVEEISLENITEEEFLNKVVEVCGTI
jgi:hypothetical protein